MHSFKRQWPAVRQLSSQDLWNVPSSRGYFRPAAAVADLAGRLPVSGRLPVFARSAAVGAKFRRRREANCRPWRRLTAVFWILQTLSAAIVITAGHERFDKWMAARCNEHVPLSPLPVRIHSRYVAALRPSDVWIFKRGVACFCSLKDYQKHLKYETEPLHAVRNLSLEMFVRYSRLAL